MRLLIPAALLCAMLCGCYEPRPVDPIMESHALALGGSMPRAFREGRTWTHAGRLATAEELKGCVTGTTNAYLPARDVIMVQSDGCYLATLRHEQQHLTDYRNGIRDRSELERRAFVSEIRCLVIEQGWTVDQVKALSRLNASIPDATYKEILK